MGRSLSVTTRCHCKLCILHACYSKPSHEHTAEFILIKSLISLHLSLGGYYGCREDEEASEDARSRTTANANFSSRDVAEGRRLLQRYIGHCNIQTDIKEVTFLGDNDELVAAGGHHDSTTCASAAHSAHCAHSPAILCSFICLHVAC